ncbi:DUF4032 domain-containing protein [Candidatus Rhodoluna planktonica]|uniref:Lipopolysaccharide kinase n=1 Tax=Candidatus Rhodoluna planktonica TaxID=535712 RepID=A0A1D9DY35_9MICO|nr:DUF4032 domain-containing protein [Candidatus Rhodoluna planktonica]AOY55728.1 lipopolysaccharide kinase [Candidatus Rhodoluna planktonica]
MTSLDITAATVDPALLDLPWHLPLEEWPADHIAALPKGLSRHTVRFAHLGDHVIAIKETLPELAKREYEMLKNLLKLDVPCVEPFAIINNRTSEQGEPLLSVLITRHLKFSLPYRAMWSQGLRPETATRLVDALALLLVRLHIAGFFWGDVSLSNTLFRRDAGAFAAYLVDAETGQLYDSGLSNGQRENDLEIARVNIAGELMDLVASGNAAPGVDPVATSSRIVSKYRELWSALTSAETFSVDEKWKIGRRVQALNELGFDIEEMAIKTTDDGSTLKIQPKVVDAGHHSRRLLRLTGLDVEENQARRLLNDLDQYRLEHPRPGADEEVLAHEWLSHAFEPVVTAIPRELHGRLEPAEIYHQVLEHKWYLCQEQNRDVPLVEAVHSYIDNVLIHRRDEEAYLAPATEAITLPNAVPSGTIVVDDEDEVDWRDLV